MRISVMELGRFTAAQQSFRRAAGRQLDYPPRCGGTQSEEIHVWDAVVWPGIVAEFEVVRRWSMANHDAKWAYEPDLSSIGQYYCSMCGLELEIRYYKSDTESPKGWHWDIRNSSFQIVDSMGNKYASKYEPDVGALTEVKEDGLQHFKSRPCCRPS